MLLLIFGFGAHRVSYKSVNAVVEFSRLSDLGKPLDAIFCGYICRYSLISRIFPCAPVSSLAFNAVEQFSFWFKLTFKATKTSFWAGLTAFTEIDSNVIPHLPPCYTELTYVVHETITWCQVWNLLVIDQN